MLEIHRCVYNNEIKVISTSPSFSNFDFVDEYFNGLSSLRRCLSVARVLGMQTITMETISPSGIIKDEIDELQKYFPSYICKALYRLGFWKEKFYNEKDISSISNDDLIGYAILKYDFVSEKERKRDNWHIFEALLKKHSNFNNYIHKSVQFLLRINKTLFLLRGILYCQQNTLNKACAQVALRSLLLKHISESDIAYSKLNKLAGITPNSNRIPGEGLTSQEIRNIFEKLGISCFDIDYDQTNSETIRKLFPYQKYLYSGIESGAGALLGFQFSGPVYSEKTPPIHIIPFFGHTFNDNAWVPDAETAYFNVGGNVDYIPSENWTSSFIGHDDNFGCNFCVPRLYIHPDQVRYVVELLPKNVRYSGVKAEVQSLYFLYSMIYIIKKYSFNSWMKKLFFYIKARQIVLRPVFISNNHYIMHLKHEKDWNGNEENQELVNDLKDLLPEKIWVIEISIIHLFPANKRKIGEILLNPYIEYQDSAPFGIFIAARLPEVYILYTGNSRNSNNPEFVIIPSEIKSHTPLINY